jgi:hypothetical protein
LGANAESLLAVNTNLKGALESSQRRLEELRRAQAAAEARAVLYADLARRLKSMIDAGDLAITPRDGRMVLRLSNDRSRCIRVGPAWRRPTELPFAEHDSGVTAVGSD